MRVPRSKISLVMWIFIYLLGERSCRSTIESHSVAIIDSNIEKFSKLWSLYVTNVVHINRQQNNTNCRVVAFDETKNLIMRTFSPIFIVVHLNYLCFFSFHIIFKDKTIIRWFPLVILTSLNQVNLTKSSLAQESNSKRELTNYLKNWFQKLIIQKLVSSYWPWPNSINWLFQSSF